VKQNRQAAGQGDPGQGQAAQGSGQTVRNQKPVGTSNKLD
jgi:hypothetical protein